MLLVLEQASSGVVAGTLRFPRFGTDNRGTYLAAIRWVDDAVRRVREKLAAAGTLERTGGAGVVERGVRIDPGIADRLRAMGYLQRRRATKQGAGERQFTVHGGSR